MSCIVANCTRRQGLQKVKEAESHLPYVSQESITFHRFPVDVEMKNKWLKALERVQGTIQKTGNAQICSKHFTLNSFININKSRRLRADAVPSLFLSNQTDGESSRINIIKGIFSLDIPGDALSNRNLGITELECISVDGGPAPPRFPVIDMPTAIKNRNKVIKLNHRQEELRKKVKALRAQIRRKDVTIESLKTAVKDLSSSNENMSKELNENKKPKHGLGIPRNEINLF